MSKEPIGYVESFDFRLNSSEVGKQGLEKSSNFALLSRRSDKNLDVIVETAESPDKYSNASSG